MSRRSSVSSSSATSAKSGATEDDPLMRDCYDLRRRLLQTEQSLQSLNPPYPKNRENNKPRQISRNQLTSYERRKDGSDRNYHRRSPDDASNLNGHAKGYPSSSPESAGVLTLADLSPAHSDSNPASRSKRTTPVPPLTNSHHSLRSSFPDLRNGSTHSSPRENEVESRSIGSFGDSDHDTLRKKLTKQREENSQLVSQNHKLMTELENTSYELHQARNRVKIVSSELENEKKRLPTLEDRIVSLEAEVASQEDLLRMTENQLEHTKDDLLANTEELTSVRKSLSLAENELREETRCRRRTEEQYDETLRNIEELTDKFAEQDAVMKSLRKESFEKEKYWKESYMEAEKRKDELQERSVALEAQVNELKQEIRLLQDEGVVTQDSRTMIEQENSNLRTTISRQSQKIGRLENELKRNEPFLKESGDLNNIIERQREKIGQYQREMEETKVHMSRLEELVHQVQEQSMKEHVNATPSTSDSGISSSHRVNGYCTGSPGSNGSFLNGDMGLDSHDTSNVSGSGGSTRAVIADLKLKLAVKDAEIQKLQASAVARAAAQQKQIAGLANEGGVMDGLRSELSAIVERSRIGDRKQQELEQIITRLEDESARYSAQNIQLEERLADKMAQNASLESKLGQRNLKIVDLQKSLEEKVSEINDLQRDVRQKASQVTHLERQLDEKMSAYGSHAAKLKEMQEELKVKHRRNGELEGAIEVKEAELKEAQTLMEKVKSLHMEQCKELEHQIEELQAMSEERNVQVSQLDGTLSASRQELNVKSSAIEKLEKCLQESLQEIQTRDAQAAQHDIKLQELQDQATQATRQVQQLEVSLAECQKEIQVYVHQLDETRKAHDQETGDKKAEINKLEKIIQQARADLKHRGEQVVQLERSLTDRQNLLQQAQGRMRELEEAHSHLQHQVAMLEQEIERERATAEEETNELHRKLNAAREDLEQRTTQMNELNSTMREVHKDMKHSSTNIVELEQLLQQSRSLSDKKAAQVQTLEQALKETKSQLTVHTKRNGELEERLRQLETQLAEKTQHSAQLDSEVTKVQSELQETMKELKDLQEVLQSSQQEAKAKEQRVNELDKLLNESMEELHQKEKELSEKNTKMAELDQSVKEQQWELKQRAAQVSQLDMSMKEHRSELQQKVITLEHSLKQARYELSERAVEVAELKAKFDQSQEQLRQKKARTDHLDKLAKQQQQELKKRAVQLANLEREMNKWNKQKEDSEETNQELRIAREQLQNTHTELMEARRELLKIQRTEQELLQELDDAHELLTTKENDCTRLAKELGAAHVREAQVEARCVQEIRKSQQDNQLRQVTQEQELQHLQESHAKLLASKEQEEANHRLQVQHKEERVRRIDQEMAQAREHNKNLAAENRRLAEQLGMYVEEAKNVNETLVIKDAEIARLEAKISGYERATFGTRTPRREGLGHRSTRTGSSSHVRHVTSPRLVTRPHYDGMKKSSSDHNLRSLADTSTLLTFSNLNVDDLYNSETHERAARGSGRSHLTSRPQDNSHSQNTQSNSVDIESLEDLLKQATFEMSQETEPVLLSPSTAQTSDMSHSSGESSAGQLSPPQKQTAAHSQTELRAQPDQNASEDNETLREQLEKKKAAMVMTRDQVNDDMAPLDPEQCRASLQERLRANEVRRKTIDQQLLNMNSEGVIMS